MHDSLAQLVGAREGAYRLLYSEGGVARSWPSSASAYRTALLEIITAVDEVLTVERYPVNPDCPEEGSDLRVTLSR